MKPEMKKIENEKKLRGPNMTKIVAEWADEPNLISGVRALKKLQTVEEENEYDITLRDNSFASK